MRSLSLQVGLLACAAAITPLGAASGGQTEARYEKSFTQQHALPYLISVPEGYDPQGEPVPLLVFLHGIGERGDDLGKLKRHGPPMLIEQGKKFPAIVVSPQCPPDAWWGGEQTRAVLGLIDHIEANYHVDPDRIYLTGVSMGGYGTWEIAGIDPERFAAVVPICGGGTRHIGQRIAEAETSVWAFHGANDRIVPIAETEWVIKWIRRTGADPDQVRFTVYPDEGHNVWTRAYDDPALWAWLFAQRRAPQEAEPADQP